MTLPVENSVENVENLLSNARRFRINRFDTHSCLKMEHILNRQTAAAAACRFCARFEKQFSIFQMPNRIINEKKAAQTRRGNKEEMKGQTCYYNSTKAVFIQQLSSRAGADQKKISKKFFLEGAGVSGGFSAARKNELKREKMRENGDETKKIERRTARIQKIVDSPFILII